ncbi:uncharacterized protein Eint_100810 [Encephalitozoon intestinalis ATCC 50506]|uniref:Uncharacterized protein n=1 Tax=Encephalitozoon intestinalis (strain ATCC 50506) TaxID=876142 RepID=E0S9M2_ENCIT|nr:uncharacterized protein Eint_100810 [Encephalitozoon intestinalis ATCC 50506]ADM12407.1 hypothetical protein Eint_100810 [Encephalitozoon intestinalis ATCC 50506]UTX46240.1 hypothetical protein GPK93_10g18380 [Encephalitozoon intestinalis]
MSLKESGVMVMTIGVTVFLAGAILLMDRALMISGNLLIIIGIALLARSRMFSFLRPEKMQAMVIFGMGILFQVYKLLVFGFFLEVLGLFLLLKDSIPTFRTVLTTLLFGKLQKLIK